jgi:hypothetical protein
MIDSNACVVDGNQVFGTICLMDDESLVSTANDAGKSRGAKEDEPDVLMILLEQSNDNQLSELKTIPELRRPEFLQGKLKSETLDQVKRAIAASLQCRQMCTEWGKLAISAGRKSQINDKILSWLQKELVPTGPDRSIPGSVASQENKEMIASRNEKRAALDSQSIGQVSFGSMLRKMLCCGWNPSEDILSDGPNRERAQIFVKKLNGAIFSLSMIAVNPNDSEKPKDSSSPDLVFTESVRDLKNKIHDDKGIHPDLQFLVFQNKCLQDESLLHECGILPQSTLYLIQLHCVLGVDESVRVSATEQGDLEFKGEKVRGLYRWYREGQQRPDVYMGEFSNGTLLVCGDRHHR